MLADPSSEYKFPDPDTRLAKLTWVNSTIATVALASWVSLLVKKSVILAGIGV